MSGKVWSGDECPHGGGEPAPAIAQGGVKRGLGDRVEEPGDTTQFLEMVSIERSGYFSYDLVGEVLK